MYVSKRGEKILEVGLGIHRIIIVSSQVFCIEDGWKQLVDFRLKFLDCCGKVANEGLVQEAKVGKDVMSDKNVLFLLQSCNDLGELSLDIRQLSLRLITRLGGEPFWLNAGQITTYQSLEDPCQACDL